jgi:OmpA-OmpF porin, OOP family
MKIKTLLLCTAITLSWSVCAAHAGSLTSGPRYTPRAEVSEKNYTPDNRMEDRADAESYEQYEQREPCQNYRETPRHFDASCVTEDVTVVAAQNLEEARLLPVIQSYTVLFDFDKSDVRANENETLRQVMREVDKFNPRQITVTGYTDSSGAADYNQILSREREQAVSKSLLERGIQNQTLERNARGENDQAVKTADDTKNQQNRRVVIDFRS